MSLFTELKRRNVFKVAAAYAVVSWVILQVVDSITPLLNLPEVFGRMVLVLLLIGFPIALIFAWAFEMTPDGIKKESDVTRDESITRTTATKLQYTIIGLLVIALTYFVWNRQITQTPALPIQPVSQLAQTDLNPTKNSLKITAITTPALGEKSIAVLPFENRSPDENDAYFAAGIHDDLLTQLAKVGAFKVISRTSVMEYEKTTKNLKQIGEELGVATIMEAAVQRSGNRVRINVQLIDSRTDEHLWAEIYDRKLTTDNLFDIQSDISKAIANALKTQLSPETLAAVAQMPTKNLQAYERYLQANKYSNATEGNEIKTAIALYQSAVKLDPEFKQAWAGLATQQVRLYWFAQSDEQFLTQARASLDRAKQIDADFPELYVAEGRYYYSGFLDYDKALLFYDKALKSMPSNAEAYAYKGWAFRRSGHWQQAIENVRQSLKLNPRNDFYWNELAATFLYLHRFVETDQALGKAGAINSDDLQYKRFSAEKALLENGDIQRALSESIGLQFVDQKEVRWTYISFRIVARQYEAAISVINQLTVNMEVWRQTILLREDLLAQVEFFRGNLDAAKTHAKIALQRLKQMQNDLGNDYRIYLPQARMYAVLGDANEVKILLQKAQVTYPTDAYAGLFENYEYARSFAIAGLLQETITSLEPQLSPPSATSVAYVNLDPAFDQLRDKPEFKAMLARHENAKVVQNGANP